MALVMSIRLKPVCFMQNAFHRANPGYFFMSNVIAYLKKTDMTARLGHCWSNGNERLVKGSDMDSKSISRRGFLAGTALVAGLGALAAMPTAAQAVTKYGNTKTYTSSKGYTGSVSCYLDYDTSGYIRFTSRLKVSYPCIAGSVKCNTTIMGGGSIAKSGNYVNGSESSQFMHRIMTTDLSNPYYGGFFSGSSIWSIPSFGLTCYSDTIYYQMDQGLPDPTTVAAANEALVEAVGINGTRGFVRKEDLEPFGGASDAECLEMAKTGVRYIPVYDDSGTIKVDEFEIECGFLE